MRPAPGARPSAEVAQPDRCRLDARRSCRRHPPGQLPLVGAAQGPVAAPLDSAVDRLRDHATSALTARGFMLSAMGPAPVRSALTAPSCRSAPAKPPPLVATAPPPPPA